MHWVGLLSGSFEALKAAIYEQFFLEDSDVTAPLNSDSHPLLMAAMLQLIAGGPPSVLWVVGETWVRCENSKYTIGADEPATRSQVRDLLIESGWKAQQWPDD
jgi:hypothetical protein